MAHYTHSPEAIHVVRTARRSHRCDGDYPHTREIEPGDRYTLSKLPPHSDLGNVGWWSIKLCAACLDLPAVSR